QGETEEEALANLKEALELHFDPRRLRDRRAFERLRLRLGRLKPQPFREVKRRLEAAGFVETSQKESHVKFVRRSGAVRWCRSAECRNAQAQRLASSGASQKPRFTGSTARCAFAAQLWRKPGCEVSVPAHRP